MGRPIWTEHEEGRRNGPYRIEKVAHQSWVLSREDRERSEVLASAESPSELEAFAAVHSRVSGYLRPVLFLTVYLASLAGVITGSILGSTTVVVAAGIVSAAAVVKISNYIAGRRIIRRRTLVRPAR